MKQKMLFVFAFSTFVFTSCGEEKTETGTTTETTGEPAPAPEKAKEANLPTLNVTSVIDSLNNSENLTGKIITVRAYSWGVDERPAGVININLDDEKASEATESEFQARFPKEKEDELKKLPLNAVLTIKGKLANDSYGIALEDCTIVATE